VITPVKISGKIIRRKNRRFVSISRKVERTVQSKVLALKFRRSQIGELSDAVDGGWVKYLVVLGTAQVIVKHLESVIVFLLSSVRFAKL
jgi:hypothetical protein